jgi:V8-like Glu-specific endopeptidase
VVTDATLDDRFRRPAKVRIFDCTATAIKLSCSPVLRARLTLACLAALLVTLAGAGTASALPAAIGKRLHVSAEEARQTVRFWTPARIRAARPMSVILDRHSALRRHFAQPAPGRPHRVPGQRPASRGVRAARSETVPIGDPGLVPYRVHGKVVAVAGRFLFYCSATVVNTPNKSVVFTAGHCVNSGGPNPHWYTRHWAFIPGYNHNRRPYGTFVAQELYSSAPWARSTNFNFDFAAAVLRRNGRGQRVAAAVGSRGFATGLAREQLFDAFGYPAARGFDGQGLWECQSPYLRDDPHPEGAGPLPVGIACNLPEGASGGGWVVNGNLLNSVTSFGYDDLPDETYGPYFGQAAWRLYKKAGRR